MLDLALQHATGTLAVTDHLPVLSLGTWFRDTALDGPVLLAIPVALIAGLVSFFSPSSSTSQSSAAVRQYASPFQSYSSHRQPGKNPLVRWARKIWPVTKTYADGHFFVRRGGRWAATPLFLVVLVVESTDIVFAVDSIPAIFAITQDPFIVFTSNMFAVMGLRSIFFLLAGILHTFRYLKLGLALVLGFIGVKMLIEPWVHVSIEISLGVVALTLAGAVVASRLADRFGGPVQVPPLITKRVRARSGRTAR